MRETLKQRPCREHEPVLAADRDGVLYDACPKCGRLRINGSEWRYRVPRTATERGVLREVRKHVR